MRLSDLLRGMTCTVHGDDRVEVGSIACHSARVEPGGLFVAIDGFNVSGAQFITEAVSRGAVAVAVEDRGPEPKTEPGRAQAEGPAARSANADLPPGAQSGAEFEPQRPRAERDGQEDMGQEQERKPGSKSAGPSGAGPVVSSDSSGRTSTITVPNARQFLARAANRFHGYPARQLDLVGITGTNGKTTTAWLLRAVGRHLGVEPGLIGTIEYSDGRETMPAGVTTPESLDLVQLLARMVVNRVPVCVAEVSSHALALDRVFGLDFRVGVFTNLTQDHLDFHRTQAEYRAAKMKLFAGLSATATAVVNLDDPVGPDIAALTRARVLGYGTGREGAGNGSVRPDIGGRVTGVGPDGLGVEVGYQGRSFQAQLQLVGRYNLMNLLAAFGVGVVLGWEPVQVLRGAESLASVPGRLERVENDRGLHVFVDYAHTPDALERMLATVREFTAGRVVAVFGCGGDRDRAKRPLMGRAVALGADVAVVTSDNPRSEAPDAIIREVVAGMTGSQVPLLVPDREEAIARALSLARPGDSVVIAGKGHEDYQIIGSERRQFDDRVVARRLLNSQG